MPFSKRIKHMHKDEHDQLFTSPVTVISYFTMPELAMFPHGQQLCVSWFMSINTISAHPHVTCPYLARKNKNRNTERDYFRQFSRHSRGLSQKRRFLDAPTMVLKLSVKTRSSKPDLHSERGVRNCETRWRGGRK